MLTIFVVDKNRLEITEIKVAENKWRQQQFVTCFNNCTHVVSRGGWTHLASFAGFDNLDKAIRFKKRIVQTQKTRNP